VFNINLKTEYALEVNEDLNRNYIVQSLSVRKTVNQMPQWLILIVSMILGIKSKSTNHNIHSYVSSAIEPIVLTELSAISLQSYTNPVIRLFTAIRLGESFKSRLEVNLQKKPLA
jgi:hypothetical protein